MSHRSSIKRLFVQGIALICFCATVGNAFGQAAGRIGGTVVDSTGAVVPGASVECANNQTGLTRTVQTNQVAVFEFPDLPIGQYVLSVTKQGFATERRDQVTLLTGQVLYSVHSEVNRESKRDGEGSRWSSFYGRFL